MHAIDKRLQRVIDNQAAKESRFALLRLIGTLICIGIISSQFSNWNASHKFAATALALLAFMATSVWQTKVTSKGKAFNGRIMVGTQKKCRRLRQDTFTPYWRQSSLNEIPKGHLYAADLDLGTTVFPWIDTCSTQAGSKKLLQGMIGDDSYIPTSISTMAQSIALQKHVMDAWEAERYLAAPVVSDSQLDLPPQESPLWPWVRLAACIAGIIAWVVLLVPPLLEFWNTSDAELLLPALTRYLPFPILTAILLQPVVAQGNKLHRQMKPLQKALVLSRSDNSHSAGYISTFQRLGRLGEMVTLRGNPIFWAVLHIICPFDPILGIFLERTVRRTMLCFDDAQLLATNFDVACALGRIAAENSDAKFCTIAQTDSLIAKNMGHPLIPIFQRQNNNFDLGNKTALVLLTGSNMAGKSTFLRTIGINTMLNNMGAPVFASEFCAPKLKILCAIRVEDSLDEGTSYFYAEVKRLKIVLDEITQNTATLFLVDEIFRGTNNKERYIGSKSLLVAFLNTQSIGVVSTHDLALAELANQQSRLVNMHFSQSVAGSSLTFDYKLRPGPCPTTNALDIMRAEGLPVLAEV